jgi:hypothetical protein
MPLKPGRSRIAQTLPSLCLALAGLVGCGSDETSPDGNAQGPGGGSTPDDVVGCQGATLLESPSDPAARGPWSVGARTATVAESAVEIWYPAALGSAAGESTATYDVRKWLPADQQDVIPDEDNPWQSCDCYRDIALDEEHGPYPVIVFLHGTAGFRTQSLSQMTHWASRGFVVLAMDHSGLYLGDALSFQFGADLPGDASALIGALAAPSGELAFLDGRIDMDRMGMAGHSAGGMGLVGFGKTAGMRVLVPMAAGGVEEGDFLESALVLGGMNDGVVEYDKQISGYDSTTVAKRLVGLSAAGHLAFSDLCSLKNTKGQDIVEIAVEYEIPNAAIAANSLWDGCEPDALAQDVAMTIVNFASTAAFEEVLHCRVERAATLADIESKYPDVGDYRESP